MSRTLRTADVRRATSRSRRAPRHRGPPTGSCAATRRCDRAGGPAHRSSCFPGRSRPASPRTTGLPTLAAGRRLAVPRVVVGRVPLHAVLLGRGREAGADVRVDVGVVDMLGTAGSPRTPAPGTNARTTSSPGGRSDGRTRVPRLLAEHPVVHELPELVGQLVVPPRRGVALVQQLPRVDRPASSPSAPADSATTPAAATASGSRRAPAP